MSKLSNNLSFILAFFGGAFSLGLASSAYGQAYYVSNNMTNVQMCYNSVNSGGNQPNNFDNIKPGSTVPLSAGLPPSYWVGVNYNLRPSSCSCSDSSCAYLGNLNLVANDDGVTETTSDLQVSGFSMSKTSATSYNLAGSAPAQATAKNQSITNGTDYLLCNGTANEGSAGVTYNPDNKVPAGELSNGDTVTLAVDTTPYYSGVNFNIRKGGCGTNDAYYGNINFSTQTDPKTGVATVVMAPTGPSTGANAIGLSATCTAYTGAGAGYGCTIDKMTLTPPPQVVFNPVKTYTQNTGVLYRGANLAGAEFGQYWSPGNVPYPAEFNYYIGKGMNTVRLPIRWAYLQPQGPDVGPIEANYATFIKNVLENLTQAGVTVILDLHDYQRYAPQGETVGVPENAATGSVPNGTINTSTQLANIWTDLVKMIQSDPKINSTHLIFDISNEPAQMDTESILTFENAAIQAIRAAGAKNMILVEGNMFSGLWAWENTTTYNNGSNHAAANSIVFTPAKIIDPDNNYAINVHQYFDQNGSMSGTTQNCIPSTELLSKINADPFLEWVKTNKVKVMVTEFGVGRGTTPEEGANCMADLKVFLDWMNQNAYTPDNGGFIGWTIWSAGHAWGDYNTQGVPNYLLDISPYTPAGGGATVDSPQMKALLDGGLLS